MRRIISFFVALLAIAMTALGAEPKGEMLQFTFDQSRIYPGTTRSVNVYVPSQYRADAPACSIVRMDGNGHNLPAIMEELIDEGSMPVTIAIFITSGQIRDEKGEVLRYNRSNEFDRMTSKWAEFIENEILPEVEKLKTSDGRPIRISRRAADRMINGDSSGGIAALNAAWQRPDLYSRVYSIVGTFVPMRGGDTFPTLIRKSEPKPLRIFLQDNDKDSWNQVFGSWYEYNLIMASALQYAGYDARFQWDEGGHSGTNGGRIMKDVLRYLWAGWPAEVDVRFGSNDLVNSLVIPGEGWVECSEMGAEPATEATYPGGAYVARAKAHTNCIRTALLGKDGSESYEADFYWLHEEGGVDEAVRHLAFDTEGWLYASSALGIQVCDHNGRVRAILSVPNGRLESFAFSGDHLFVTVDGRVYARRIAHQAATASSPRPNSQGQG